MATHVSGLDCGESKSAARVLDRTAHLADVRALSRINNWHSLRAIAVQWLIISASCAATLWFQHWGVFLAAIAIIATRQHALAVLVHEAAHYRLFTNRMLNDVVSDLCLGFPLGISTSLYREFHLDHHRYVMTELDPEIRVFVIPDDDWKFPKKRLASLVVFLKDALGINAYKILRAISYWSPLSRSLPWTPPVRRLCWWEYTSLCGFCCVVGAVIYLTNAWSIVLLLWLLPTSTLLGVLLRLRGIAEHKGLKLTNELTSTRTVLANPIERFLIAPCGVNYHLEHHLFPSVTCFNLPKLHARLMQDPKYRAEAHITHGYLNPWRGVVAELCGDFSTVWDEEQRMLRPEQGWIVEHADQANELDQADSAVANSLA